MPGCLAVAQPSAVDRLKIEVTAVRSAEGAIVLAVFDQEKSFAPMDANDPVAASVLPAAAGSIHITVHALPAGACAATAAPDAFTTLNFGSWG